MDQGGLTVGVEEEFLIVDPRTRTPVPLGAEVAATASDDELEIQLEISPAQVETATGVCSDLEELHEQLARGRRLLASAAARVGGRLLASGVPLLGDPPKTTAATPRYREIAERYGALAIGNGLCACHVHVGVPSQAVAVQVSNYLRPWLPVLSTVTANSPFFHGADTGYASWRSLLWSRWPLAGPPPHFESEWHYNALVDELIGADVIMDTGMIYWYVRPSAHVPTVEVRIGDVATTVDDAVLLAGMVRGLVATAVEEIRHCRPAPPIAAELVRAACWQAARSGPGGTGVDLLSGGPAAGWAMIDRLLDHIGPALAAAGDDGIVKDLAARLRARGCGADRQRADYEELDDIRLVVDAAVQRTCE